MTNKVLNTSLSRDLDRVLYAFFYIHYNIFHLCCSASKHKNLVATRNQNVMASSRKVVIYTPIKSKVQAKFTVLVEF